MTNATISDLMSKINAPFESASGVCDVHGKYTTTVMVINGDPLAPECTECLQERIKTERAEESARYASEQQVRNEASRLAGINLPLRMQTKRWSDYMPANTKAAKFLATCKTFADDWLNNYEIGASLIMTGGTGCGKTHLASVLCKQVAIQHQIRPRYTTASAMIRYIRGSYGGNCEYTETQAFEIYAKAPLLVIDEVGVKLASDHDKSVLFEIIDERYQGELPTVLISNLSVKEINEYIDARLVDRLSENGQLMVFDWGSHRGAGG